LLLSFLLITSLSLNYLLGRLVIRPVFLLRDAMRRVQEGWYGQQMDLESGDEIGEMAAAFNDMSAQLKEKHAALSAAIQAQDLYSQRLEETNVMLERLNVDLEKMVAERTAELTESNRQLQAEIEERARAEASLFMEKERLAVTLRSIGDGVITTDTAGRVVLTNQVADRLTGRPLEEAIGRSIEEVFPITEETDLDPDHHPVSAALRTGQPLAPPKPVILTGGAGRRLIVSYSVAPIRDTDQRVIGAVLVFRDVTEQNRLEQEAQKSAKLESLGILAGGIAHDFNNIMTAILGNISLARLHTRRGGKTFDKLVEAEKAIMHAKGLTRQLLTFSKGGAPIKTTTSVRELLMDTTTFALSGSRVKCSFQIADDLWPLNIDPAQISQVINNMVLNAVQAMPNGGVVTVAAENQAFDAKDEHLPVKRGRYVVISISDQGVGIPEELRTKIFDPYFTTKERGSGLGLSTSYSIIKNHGGFVDLESRLGEGSTFHLYLPATETGGPDRTASEHAVVKGRGRILLMDDEEEILAVTAEALGLLGYSVDTARDGEQAIAKYVQALETDRRFDALIMDLTIPGGMGGQEALRELKKIDPRVRAVVSSGYSQDPVMAEFGKFGFVDVLPKPFRLEEMSQVLGRVIAGNDA
ncbi:MAG: ATP-binding protein, partial [Thermodesulfobacteriota bacterium]